MSGQGRIVAHDQFCNAMCGCREPGCFNIAHSHICACTAAAELREFVEVGLTILSYIKEAARLDNSTIEWHELWPSLDAALVPFRDPK